MKAYIATTGVLFLLITGAHVMRATSERHLVRDPWFIATTIIALALVGWAARLLSRSRTEPPALR